MDGTNRSNGNLTRAGAISPLSELDVNNAVPVTKAKRVKNFLKRKILKDKGQEKTLVASPIRPALPKPAPGHPPEPGSQPTALPEPLFELRALPTFQREPPSESGLPPTSLPASPSEPGLEGDGLSYILSLAPEEQRLVALCSYVLAFQAMRVAEATTNATRSWIASNRAGFWDASTQYRLTPQEEAIVVAEKERVKTVFNKSKEKIRKLNEHYVRHNQDRESRALIEDTICVERCFNMRPHFTRYFRNDQPDSA